MSLLAVDPGCPDCGCALYNTRGRLVRAAWSRIVQAQNQRCPACRTVGTCAHGSLPTDWMAICDAIEEDMGVRSLERPIVPQIVVVEFPQVFYRRPASGRGGNAIGGGKHIMPLAAVSAMMLDRGRRLGARTYAFTPGSWKGTKRKDLFQCEILALLTPEERLVLPRLRARDGRLIYRTDPLDAAGLGLHFLIRAGERQATFYDHPATFANLVEKEG